MLLPLGVGMVAAKEAASKVAANYQEQLFLEMSPSEALKACAKSFPDAIFDK